MITIDPEVLNGPLCFCRTPVSFQNLIDYLEGGHSLGEFLHQFRAVMHEMAVQVLEEAMDSLLGG